MKKFYQTIKNIYRTHKTVDYSEYDEVKERSDDDFDNDFAPPSKKARTKTQNVKNELKCRNERNNPRERLSLDDKLYQRDVEKALQLSIESQPLSQESKNRGRPRNKQQFSPLEDQKPDVFDLSLQESNETFQEENSGNEEDENCDSEQETGYESEDEDYQEDKEKNDSDFGCEENNKKITKKSKASATKIPLKAKIDSINSQKVVTPCKQPSRTKVQQRKTVDQCAGLSKKSRTTVTGKKIPSSLNSSLSAIKNKGCNPGLGGVVIKNPGPPIRVGLSRNRKVKPLHAKVSVTP